MNSLLLMDGGAYAVTLGTLITLLSKGKQSIRSSWRIVLTTFLIILGTATALMILVSFIAISFDSSKNAFANPFMVSFVILLGLIGWTVYLLTTGSAKRI